jgi:hypothetical protein
MHVRVCVECGEEYRPGIVTCADCGGALEDRHGDEDGAASPPPVDPAEDAEDGAFVDSVLHAERAPDLIHGADRLRDSGIPFRLRPAAKGQGHGYHLLVAEGDRDRALRVLGIAADAREGECPACGTRLAEQAPECPECGLAVGEMPEDA